MTGARVLPSTGSEFENQGGMRYTLVAPDF
jgi:hypothetical protein